MDIAQAPVSHVFEEMSARRSYDNSLISGSTSQTQAALLNVLDSDTSGAWQFLMPGEAFQARELRRGFADEQAMAQMLQMRRAVGVTGLETSSALAAAGGQGAESRKLERDARYSAAVNRAHEEATKGRETYNLTGKQTSAQQAYHDRITQITADLSAKVGQGIMSTSEGDAALAAATAGEKANLDAKLQGYKHEFDQFLTNENANVAKADALKAASEADDLTRQKLLDVKSKYEASGIRSAASGELAIARGGGAAAELDAYNQKLKEKLELLRDIERKTPDDDDKRRAKEAADAQEFANQKLREAKSHELARKREDVDFSIRARSEGLDVRDAELSGNSVVATRLRAKNEAGQTARAAVTKYSRGGTLGHLVGELFQSLRVAGQGELAAQQQEAQQAGDLAADESARQAMKDLMNLRPRDAAMREIHAQGAGLRARYNSPGFDRNSDEGKRIKSKLDTLDARRQLQEFRFQRSDEETLVGLNASISSSRFAQHDQPMAAQAAEAIGAAKLAIERARDQGLPPEVMKKAQEAQVEHLKAIRHELTGQHGGEFAIHGGHGLAGLTTQLARSRLGRGGNDRDAADKELAAAIRELTAAMKKNQPAGGHPITPPR